MDPTSVAEKFYKEGNYLGARQIYDELLNNEPGNINLLMAKANCCLSLCQWQECFKSILEAYKANNWTWSFEYFVDGLVKQLNTTKRSVDHLSKKQSEDNLICECCFALLCDPITISCGHTFCRRCTLKNKKCLSCSDGVIYNGEDTSVNIVLSNIIGSCFKAKVTAVELRFEGNECFAQNRYEDALRKYKEALHLGKILGRFYNFTR